MFELSSRVSHLLVSKRKEIHFIIWFQKQNKATE